MAKARPDLVVIGGGSAGLGAAFAARFRGKRVTIVQDGPIGGDCTFTGCVPSKALLAAASKGLSFGDAMGRVRQAVEAVAYEERAEVLRGRGIDVIEGSARMRGGGRVEVDGSEVAADRLVIAAGSAPAVPPIPGLAEAGCLTSDDLFALEQRPARLVIIGGGPIGCEMAQAFSLFGTEVVLIEGAERLLPRDDADASRAIHTSLTRRGVRVVLGVAVDRVTAIESNTVEVKAGAERFIADQLLVATGRAPALDSLDPEAGGVELTDRGWVKVDDHLATTAEGVYAAGDVVGSVQLTHAAAAMASVAVDNALGSGMARFRRRRWLPETIPWVTFTTPEVGQIGG